MLCTSLARMSPMIPNKGPETARVIPAQRGTQVDRATAMPNTMGGLSRQVHPADRRLRERRRAEDRSCQRVADQE